MPATGSKEGNPISAAHLAAGRAVDSFRRQLPIVLRTENGVDMGAYPIEGLTSGLLAELQALPGKCLSLLLTGARAHYLKLCPEGTPTLCLDADGLSLTALQTLADPLINGNSFGEPLPNVTILPAMPAHELLLAMAKYSSLMPAIVTIENALLPESWMPVAASDLIAYWSAPVLDMLPIAHAMLPIEGAEHAKLACFRQRYGTSTHLALLFGDIAAGSTPLTRVHSSCITGDILGSMRCDCGDQLHLALEQLKTAKSGILLYLHQEGRGIGIANKLRAYQLQEQGQDTYDANLALGFDMDERDFSIAGAILKKLGVHQIRLLTNNPQKMANLEKAGIRVSERVPLIIPAGSHNHAYLDAKAKKSGHLFGN